MRFAEGASVDVCGDRGILDMESHSNVDNEEWRVAFVGDSVLDNHYWLKNPADDVRAQTERTLRGEHPTRTIYVENFAVDESTVVCILRGRTPATHYKDGRKLAGMEPYPTDTDGVVRPLSLLRKSKPTHVVISIGGNDARIRFLQSRNPDVITELMVTDGLVANLKRVVEIIRSEITPNVILLYVFMPEFKMFPILSFLPPARILQRLLENFAALYFEIAREFSLPIIDLSRTFDPNDKSHYGSTPIEPSNISGQFIADLISQVLIEFNFGREKSGKVFSGIGDENRVFDLNPDAGFNYKHEFQAFLERRAASKRQRSVCCIA